MIRFLVKTLNKLSSSFLYLLGTFSCRVIVAFIYGYVKQCRKTLGNKFLFLQGIVFYSFVEVFSRPSFVLQHITLIKQMSCWANGLGPMGWPTHGLAASDLMTNVKEMKDLQ